MRCVLRFLERQQDAPADLGRVLDLLQARRDRFPLVMAEVVVPRAGRDDQIVVRDAPLSDQHLARGGIDAGDVAEQDGRVALAPRMLRIGCAMSAGDRAAVATW